MGEEPQTYECANVSIQANKERQGLCLPSTVHKRRKYLLRVSMGSKMYQRDNYREETQDMEYQYANFQSREEYVQKTDDY